MSEWYYLDEERTSLGPVTEDEIHRLLAQRRLSGNSLVWRADMGSDWRPIVETPLRSGLQPPPTAPKAVADAPVPPAAPARGRFFGAIAWIIGIHVVGLILLIVSEASRDAESFASGVGLSVSECRKVAMKFGLTPDQADTKCSEPSPKKGR